jgi:hypothetical protein
VAACTTANSLVWQDTSANTAVSAHGEMSTRIFVTEIHRETDLTTNEAIVGAFEVDSCQMISTEQTIKVPSKTSTLLQVVTSIEDVILVKDVSYDEEATLVAQSTFVESIFLTTIEDCPSHSMVEENTKPVLVEDGSDDEEATLVAQTTFEGPIFLTTIKDGPSLSMVEDNTKPRLVEDPPIVTIFSSTELERMRILHALFKPRSPSTTTVRYQRKSHNSSSLCQSARLAHHGVFKDLDIVGIDGKPNESSIQDCIDHLKELLSPNLLNKLLSLKGSCLL